MSAQAPSRNGMPFTKLTVSDAIGLITLRLGRLEQHMNSSSETSNNHEGQSLDIPANSKIIDASVLNNMISRLDSLEKMSVSKELKETKDLLAHFLFKFELFVKETNDKFADVDALFDEAAAADAAAAANTSAAAAANTSDAAPATTESILLNIQEM